MAISASRLSQEGFHLLKKECSAHARIEIVVERIIEWFDILVENTLRMAPLRSVSRHRKDPFKLKRINAKNVAHEEAKLERSFAAQWKCDKSNGPVEGCGGFASYQVPLLDKQGPWGWGYVDLVGVSRSTLLPQVWELKAADTDDSPFSILVQALAYGIAIRHAWNRGEFMKEWGDRLKCGASSIPGKLEQHERQFELFGVVPASYWEAAKDAWLGTDRRWELFDNLRGCVKRSGFGFRLVKFETEENKSEDQKPNLLHPYIIKNVEEIKLKELTI